MPTFGGPASVPRCGKRTQNRAGSGLQHFLEVLDRWERVIEVVEQSTPLPILGRTAKALGVIFKRFPLHQEKERTWLLDTPGEFQAAEPSHRGDDLLRRAERFEEVTLFPGSHG